MVTAPTEVAEPPVRRATVWLLRLTGIVLFVLGISYWVKLVGIYEGALWRFDLMPLWWKAAAAALAVLYPVAGIGLWMTVSWGAVVWMIVAAIEAAMHLGFPHLFGGPTPWLLFHPAALLLLLTLKLVAWRQGRRRPRVGLPATMVRNVSSANTDR